MRPRPQWGQGWRKGDDHHGKRGFLPSSIFTIDTIFFPGEPDMNGSSDPQGERKGKCSLTRAIVDKPAGVGDRIIHLIAMGDAASVVVQSPREHPEQKKEDRGSL